MAITMKAKSTVTLRGEKMKKCCICKLGYTGFGNNALPLKDGRCCDACNDIVFVARITAHIEDNLNK